MILRKLANFIDFKFLHIYVENKWYFLFKIWEMVEKINTDVDIDDFYFEKWKNCNFSKIYGEKFFICKSKSSLFTSVFVFFTIFPKLWKQNFINFRRKHIETGPSCSRELITFLKYKMPLRPYINWTMCLDSYLTCISVSETPFPCKMKYWVENVWY